MDTESAALRELAQNQIWSTIVAIACELITRMQMLSVTGHDARRW